MLNVPLVGWILRTHGKEYEEMSEENLRNCSNSHPLTYLCGDGGEPLTPSHLVVGRRLLSTPTETTTTTERRSERRQEMSRREKHLQTLLQHFWSRWQKVYLMDLREDHRPYQSKGTVVNVGEIVCIQEDNVLRLNWSMGGLSASWQAEMEMCAQQKCEQ